MEPDPAGTGISHDSDVKTAKPGAASTGAASADPMSEPPSAAPAPASAPAAAPAPVPAPEDTETRNIDHDSLVTVRLSEPPTLHVNTSLPMSILPSRRSLYGNEYTPTEAMAEIVHEEEHNDEGSEGFPTPTPASKLGKSLQDELDDGEEPKEETEEVLEEKEEESGEEEKEKEESEKAKEDKRGAGIEEESTEEDKTEVGTPRNSSESEEVNWEQLQKSEDQESKIQDSDNVRLCFYSFPLFSLRVSTLLLAADDVRDAPPTWGMCLSGIQLACADMSIVHRNVARTPRAGKQQTRDESEEHQGTSRGKPQICRPSTAAPLDGTVKTNGPRPDTIFSTILSAPSAPHDGSRILPRSCQRLSADSGSLADPALEQDPKRHPASAARHRLAEHVGGSGQRPGGGVRPTLGRVQPVRRHHRQGSEPKLPRRRDVHGPRRRGPAHAGTGSQMLQSLRRQDWLLPGARFPGRALADAHAGQTGLLRPGQVSRANLCVGTMAFS